MSLRTGVCVCVCAGGLTEGSVSLRTGVCVCVCAGGLTEGSVSLRTGVCVAECHVENPGLCASFLKTSFSSHRRRGHHGADGQTQS